MATFNAMLVKNAGEAQQSATRYAEFIKGRTIEAPSSASESDIFYHVVGVRSEGELPDPDGDPSR